MDTSASTATAPAQTTPNPNASAPSPASSAAPSNSNAASSSIGDQMDISVPQPAQPSTVVSTVSGRRHQETSQASSQADPPTNGVAQPNNVNAASVGQQPKVIQTAFIHKLYNMLEERSIQHLISWSSTNDSFLISPTAEFSKVLSTYFKHTNVSSFVRQLNMYGFHKVSDVFQTGSPDSPLWEFKHGNGSFKRGDLAGLKEIKRRASRHTLTHRDSIAPSQKQHHPPATPSSTTEQASDSFDSRLNTLERHFYDAHVRLTKAEDSYATMSAKCQVLTDTLIQCYSCNQTLTSMLISLVPDADHHVNRQARAMQEEMTRQVETLKSMESTNAHGSERRTSYTNAHFENGQPLSPFQLSQDDQRRTSLASNTMRLSGFKHPFSSRSAAASPRRYGSISAQASSPPPPIASSAFAPPAAPQHNRQNSIDPNSPHYLSRRHTSADIRANPGWQSTFSSSENLPLPSINRSGHQSPFASGHSSGHWPSSPQPAHDTGPEQQQLQDTLGRYQIDSRNASNASNTTVTQESQHRSTTGPSSTFAVPNSSKPAGPQNNFSTPSWGNSQDHPQHSWNLPHPGSRIPFKDVFSQNTNSSGPPTRRSSVAHLLNPAETAERDDEDDDLAPDERAKRKRIA